MPQFYPRPAADQVHGLRASLFTEAVKKGLADCGDRLVTRKKVGGGKTVKEKHAEDVWSLTGVLQMCEPIPRTLLRNGKRAKEEWMRSQAKMRGEASESDVGVEQDRNGDGNSVVLCVSDEVSRQVGGEESVALDTRDKCVVENDKLSACRQMGGVEGVSSDARDENIVRDRHVQEPVDSVYFLMLGMKIL